MAVPRNRMGVEWPLKEERTSATTPDWYEHGYPYTLARSKYAASGAEAYASKVSEVRPSHILIG